MCSQELPLIENAEDITLENCEEMFNELCSGCECGEEQAVEHE